MLMFAGFNGGLFFVARDERQRHCSIGSKSVGDVRSGAFAVIRRVCVERCELTTQG